MGVGKAEGIPSDQGLGGSSLRHVPFALFVCVLLAPLAGAQGTAYTHSGTLATGLIVYSAFDTYEFPVREGDVVRAVVDWTGAPGSSLELYASMGARDEQGCRVLDAFCIVDQARRADAHSVLCGGPGTFGTGPGGQLALEVVAPADGVAQLSVRAGLAPEPIPYTITITQNGAAPDGVNFRAYPWSIGPGIAAAAACDAIGA